MTRRAFSSAVSVLVLALLTPSVSFAGFQFVAPNAAAPAPAQAAPAAVSNASVDVTDLDALSAPSSVPSSGPNSTLEPAPQPMPIGQKAIPLTPVVKNSDSLSIEAARPRVNTEIGRVAVPGVSAPMPIAPAPKYLSPYTPNPIQADIAPIPPEPIAAVSGASVDSGPAVQGFGRGVPLAIALQQIVPPSYRYSFEPPVSGSTRVTWTGGKSWKAIVAEIARDNNMNVDIASNVVAFHHASPMDTILSNPILNDQSNSMTASAPAPAPMAPIAPAPMIADKSLPEPLPLAPIMDAPVAPIAPAPMKLAANESAPMPSKIQASRAPIASMTSTAETPAPMTSSSLDDMLFDHSASGTAPKAPQPIKTASAAPISSGRTALASISDMPLDPIAPAPMAPMPIMNDELAPVKSMPAPKSMNSSFDSAMDADVPAKGTVKNKVIATADGETSTYKPMSILEPVSKTEKSSSKPAAAPVPTGKKLIEEVPPMPKGQSVHAPTKTPASGVTEATEITKQIDNEPVKMASLDMPKTITSEEAPMIKADLAKNQEWVARKNETLRQTLTAWAEQSGASLVWSSEYDYPLQTDVRINASYTDAVRTLLAGFSKAQPRPVGRLFKNDQVGAQPVLIIETQRLTN
jgi:uncharacterized lipoprotein YmbA